VVVVVEHVRDSSKVNVVCAFSSCKIYGQFFFAEPRITDISYLDMLKLWLMSQLQEDSKDLIVRQDGDPPHFHLHFRHHLNVNFPGSWFGSVSDNESPLLPWPPRSPDLTPYDVFLRGYVKDRVYLLLMPRDLPQLRQRIVETVADIDSEMFQRVCLERFTGLTSVASPKVDISSTCKAGQKLAVSLHLFTCFLHRNHSGFCTTEFRNLLSSIVF
jgi:hypothetical protein